MRASALLLALPALALAEQIPLMDQASAWFEKAKSYIPSAPLKESIIDAGASVVAADKVEKITLQNYARKLAPSTDGPVDWIIIVSGKNESCYGGCDPVNRLWNESVPLLAAAPQAPRLGFIDCDKEAVLCAAWSAPMPTLWHFSVPQASLGATSLPAGSPTGPTRLHIVPINGTTATAQDMVKVHTEKTYLETAEYTGFLHPIDGWVAQWRLTQPLGYVLRFFATTPSWMFMIGISFLSRQIMSRRMNRTMDQRGQAQAPGAADARKKQ